MIARAAICLLVLLSGCAGGQGPAATPETTAGAAESKVVVALQEWAVVADAERVPTGRVTFQVSNTGEQAHELVVVRTQLDAGQLPTTDEGAADLDDDALDVIGRTAEMAAAASENLALSLPPGDYVLLCNLIHTEHADDHGGAEVHYKLGMRTTLTVR